MPKHFYEQFNFKLKSANVDEATIEGVFSTADEDRHGDIVDQNWDLKNFKKNPVILNSHNWYDATEIIGKVVKFTSKQGESLAGKLKFAVNENPKAKVIFDLMAGGFANSFSVGFIPKEFDDKGRIMKSELLEISVVSVPANALANAKAKGIDISPLTKEYLELLKDIQEDDKKDKDDEDKIIEDIDNIDSEDEEEDIDETEEDRLRAEEDAKKDIKVEEEKEVEEEKKEEVEEKSTKKLKTILTAVKFIGDSVKADRKKQNTVSKNKQLINKSIKNLLIIKSKY